MDDQSRSRNGGKAENPDIADTYNTVLKMAKKRAHVDAIITVTAASDIFTQDVEDLLPEQPQPGQSSAKKTKPDQKEKTPEGKPPDQGPKGT